MADLAGLVGGLSLSDGVDKYPNWSPERNLNDVYRAHLTNVLHKITGVDPSIIYPACQWTTSLDKGDMIVAAPALRVKGKKPDELAKEIAEKFPEDDPLFAKPVASTYFIPLWFKPEPLTPALVKMIRELGPDFGYDQKSGLRDPKDPDKGRKSIIVEFSSPNIAKPFHAGHLRSTIIGGFLSNLYASGGWDVRRINYLGDWGKQYGLLALAFERYGDEDALQRDPINHLYELYVRINKEMAAEKEEIEALKAEGKDAAEEEAKSLDEKARGYFRKMEDGDAAAVAQWQRFRDLSIKRYKETYARLNINFDVYSGESQVPAAAMKSAASELAAKGISEEDAGAVLVNFERLVPGKEGKKFGKALIRKRDGTALYLTRDVSELLGRHERYGFDQMIYVIASQQDLHMKQLFKIVELMGHGDVVSKCQHINFGMVLGMSTRKGTVKFLDDILRDAADKMHDVMRKNEDKYSQVENPEAIADTLGISAVMIQDMRGKRLNNYTFDVEAMTSFEGDTGPYLQYAHARLCSIERKANIPPQDLASADLSLLTEPHAVQLVRMLSLWPDVVRNTFKTLEPTTVVTYLFRMTHALSSSYDVLRIVGSEPGVMRARMALYDAARVVLGNAMRLLGLNPVERM